MTANSIRSVKFVSNVARTGQKIQEQQEQQEQKQQQAQEQIQVLGADLTDLSQQQVRQQYGYNSVADLVAARKKKMSQMGGYLDTAQRGRGISSLIGRGQTLG